MAALPTIDLQPTEHNLTMDEAAVQLHKIVEDHFDSLALTEVERDARYDSLREHLDATGA